MSITPIPAWMKMEVLDRDGWYCLCCGQATYRFPDSRVRPNTLSFDHVVPEALGGPTTVENLQVLCMACNLHKGVDTIDLRVAVGEYHQALEDAYASGKPFNRGGIGPRIWRTVVWTNPNRAFEANLEARQRELRARSANYTFRGRNDGLDTRALNWPLFKKRVNEIYVPNPCPVREKLAVQQSILAPAKELVRV